MAWRKLGVVYGNQGKSEAAKKPLTRAFQFRDRLPDRERYLATGSYYSSVGMDNDKAAAAYRAVLAIDSMDPVATQQSRPDSADSKAIRSARVTYYATVSRRA